MIKHLRKMFAFDRWATSRMLDAAERLDAQSAAAREALKLLAHTSAAHVAWYRRVHGEMKPIDLWPGLDLAECRRRAEHAGDLWRDWAEEVEAEGLETVISYVTSRGDRFDSTLEDIVTHVLNHATWHRGQVARILREAGVDPPSVDFIIYVREVEAKD